MPDRMSTKMPERLPGRMLDRLAEKMRGRMPGLMLKNAVEPVGKPDQISQSMPDRKATFTRDRM